MILEKESENGFQVSLWIKRLRTAAFSLSEYLLERSVPERKSEKNKNFLNS